MLRLNQFLSATLFLTLLACGDDAPTASTESHDRSANGSRSGRAGTQAPGSNPERDDNRNTADESADDDQTDEASDSHGSLGTAANGGSAGSGTSARGALPSNLVGSWYASSGYTSAPYDPSTGAWGTPTGKGLTYNLRADGSYEKAFQSYASNLGCTTGFTAFEQGTASVSGNTILLTPTSGHVRYSDSCAPSLNSDKPSSDLSVERFSWSLAADGLTLASDNGTSTFRRLD